MEYSLLAGAAREDITPNIGARICGYSPNQYSQSIRDRLSATALAFQSGTEKTLMISATLCELDTGLMTALRKEISQKTGMKADAILIAATHTHSGPTLMGHIGWGDIDYEYYEEIFRPRVLAAAEKACASLQPVVMGIGKGISLVGINRRQLTPDNRIILGQSPWGCFNPEMTVLSFRNREDHVVANIIHYGAHGTAAGVNTAISRDWSGHMTDALDGASGGITAFFNGPEGDVGPRLSNGKTTGDGDLAYVDEMGRMAAADALRIYQTITDYHDADTAAVSSMLHLPLQKRISLEDASRLCKEYENQTINIGRQKLEYSRTVKDSYENGYQEQTSRAIEQTIIRIGSVAFAGFPYELFSEIGMRIQQAETELDVLSLSNANGDLGYFPTQDQLCRGGYEIDCFLYNEVQAYTEDADYQLMRATLDHLKNVKKVKTI